MSGFFDYLFAVDPESGWPRFRTAVPPDHAFWDYQIPDFLQPFLRNKDSDQQYDWELISVIAREQPLEWRNLLEFLVDAYFSSFALEEVFKNSQN